MPLRSGIRRCRVLATHTHAYLLYVLNRPTARPFESGRPGLINTPPHSVFTVDLQVDIRVRMGAEAEHVRLLVSDPKGPRGWSGS